MLYDRLILQEGRWHLVASERGLGMSQFIPPEMLVDERHKIEYIEPGYQFGVSVKVDGEYQQLLNEVSFVGYNVDFYPIIHDAGLLSTACYDWINKKVVLSREDQQLISRQADELILACEHLPPANRYLKNSLVEGFLDDALLARNYKMPMSVDFEVAQIISKYYRIKSELRRTVYDYFVPLSKAHFGDWSWDKILEVRESDAGVSFRRMVSRIAEIAKAAIEAGESEHDLHSHIHRQIQFELIREIEARQTTPFSTAVGLLLNVIPYGGIAGGARDLISLGAENESWFSVLKMS